MAGAPLIFWARCRNHSRHRRQHDDAAVLTAVLCHARYGRCRDVTAAAASAAGFRLVGIPADATGPAIHAAMWSPCAVPPGKVTVHGRTVPGTQDCPIEGSRLPLVVLSHGRLGDFFGHHDTAEALADAGFIVAALDHPGDTATDKSRSDDLSVFVERPTDIKRRLTTCSPDRRPRRKLIRAASAFSGIRAAIPASC